MSTTDQRRLGATDSPIEDNLEAAFTRVVDEGSQRLKEERAAADAGDPVDPGAAADLP